MIRTERYGEIHYVGDLLSKYYPTTVVYRDENNSPVIREWIDENDDGHDIFLLYKVSIDTLSIYLNGIIDHLELLKSAEDGTYCEYLNEVSMVPERVCVFDQIDKSALPRKDSFFNIEDSVDFSEIQSEFSILTLERELNVRSMDSVSQEFPDINGFFRLHINEGNNVGFGTIDTKVLGELLISFEDLYFATAQSVFSRNGIADRLSIDDHMAFLNSSKTEVFIQERASYSLYLKAKHAYRYSSEGNDSHYQFVTDEIFDRLNTLMLKSRDTESLSEIHTSYSSKVFKSLKQFAETVLANRLVVDFDYYNSSSDFNFEETLIPRDAHGIFTSVGNDKLVSTEEFSLIGSFSKLNTATGHFRFSSLNDQYFSGYVGSELFESMRQLNFNTNYNVRIERTKITLLGSVRDSYYSTMLSCTPVEN